MKHHLRTLLAALPLLLCNVSAADRGIADFPIYTAADLTTTTDRLLFVDPEASDPKGRAVTIAEMWKKLGGTNVSPTELAYLDTLTGNVQDQLDGKQPLLGVGQLALSKLSQSGATMNQVPKWSGSSWIPGDATTAVDNAAVNVAIATDPYSTREAAGINDPRAISDLLNWQPYSTQKVHGWIGSGSTLPLRVIIIGDSLSSGLGLAPNMGDKAGIIGLYQMSGAVGVTTVSSYEPYWFRPIKQIAVGGSAIFSGNNVDGSSTYMDICADTLMVAYVQEPGAGSFDVSYSGNGGTSWSTAVNVNANGTLAGVVHKQTLSKSNNPAYRMRINNVTGGSVKFIATGLYSTVGTGVINLQGLANMSGIDIVTAGFCSPAILDPIWSELAPDLAIVCFADAPEDFRDTKMTLSGGTSNGTTTISFSAYPAASYSGGNSYREYPIPGEKITGGNIPAGTYITAHTRGSTTATVSQSVPEGSGTFTVKGAWTDFYARCKAAKSATDFVMVSMNPNFAAELSGYPVWSLSTSYSTGDYVVKVNPDGIGVTNGNIYRCTSNHSGASLTEPGVGANWATVWVVDERAPGAIAGGDTRAALQASTQRSWAVANKETFINGFNMFRGYSEGCDAGLLAGDRIHPSGPGYFWKNEKIWDAIPLSRLNLGTLARHSSGSGYDLLYLTPGINPQTSSLEMSRALNIRQAGSGALSIWDQNNTYTAAASLYLKSIDYTGIAGMSGVNIFEWNNYQTASRKQGLYPSTNNYQLGADAKRWAALVSKVSAEIKTRTANYTVDGTAPDDYTLLGDATSGSFTFTLPAASDLNRGRILVFKKIDATANTVTVSHATATIDGAASKVLTAQWETLRIVSNGTNWFTL